MLSLRNLTLLFLIHSSIHSSLAIVPLQGKHLPSLIFNSKRFNATICQNLISASGSARHLLLGLPRLPLALGAGGGVSCNGTGLAVFDQCQQYILERSIYCCARGVTILVSVSNMTHKKIPAHMIQRN